MRSIKFIYFKKYHTPSKYFNNLMKPYEYEKFNSLN